MNRAMRRAAKSNNPNAKRCQFAKARELQMLKKRAPSIAIASAKPMVAADE